MSRRPGRRSSRWLAATAIVLAVGGVAVASFGPGVDERVSGPSPAGAPPIAGLHLTCAESASPAPAAAMPGRDISVGPLLLVDYRGNAREAPPRSRWGDPDRAYAWKLPLSVRAGRRVVLAIPRRMRDEAAFAFRRERRSTSRLRDGDAVLRLDACSDSPGAAYTGWPGRVLATRPICLPIDVRANGAAPKTVRVSLGAGRCPSGDGVTP